MNSYLKRQVPNEVKSWMLKDGTVRQLAENSRIISNNTRQNVILSRQFLSDALNMSYDRYRLILKNDFDKKLFLKKQKAKAERSMPGLKAHVEELTADLKNGITPSLNNYTRSETWLSSASQSPFKFAQTSDPTFNKKPFQKFNRAATTVDNRAKNENILNRTQSDILITKVSSADINKNDRQNGTLAKFEISETDLSKIQDAHSTMSTEVNLPMTAKPVLQQNMQKTIISSDSKQSRPTSSRKKTSISRVRLNQLAMPRSSRVMLPFGRQSRRILNKVTSSQLFGSLEESLIETPRESTISAIDDSSSATHDKRFRRLMTTFSESYRAKNSDQNDIRTIVSDNPSLQDTSGHWQSNENAFKLEQLRHKREILVKQFPKDIFWMDVAA
ncbi:unnamed protein product [Didymodactylos carnosus]|uniref:Uncharacterized protein n=1 Tax=Didymodactylos carnosus TaxID=1234261 RepID=A0A813W6Q8_9BILA|nr:unnamed protein product [Didymodactylos carnosus]CAF1004900.1 unnamed protein product [Didymodactylos carnosus]CAF3638396.1 unnamed protein product [Didymodactylos carnosus]CAF3774138.1 unnamed protein product [Didymodactylos carnosus]